MMFRLFIAKRAHTHINPFGVGLLFARTNHDGIFQMCFLCPLLRLRFLSLHFFSFLFHLFCSLFSFQSWRCDFVCGHLSWRSVWHFQDPCRVGSVCRPQFVHLWPQQTETLRRQSRCRTTHRRRTNSLCRPASCINPCGSEMD